MALYPTSGSSRSSFGSAARSPLTTGVLAPEAKSVVFLTGGNATVKTVSGDPLPFTGVASGYVIPFIVTEIVAISGGAVLATIDG